MGRQGWLTGPWYRPAALAVLGITLGIVYVVLAGLGAREAESRATAEAAHEAQRQAVLAQSRARADSVIRATPLGQVAGLPFSLLQLAATSGRASVDPAVFAAIQREYGRRQAAVAATAREEAIQDLQHAVMGYTFPDGTGCPRVSTARIRQLYEAHATWPREVLVRVACRAVWIGQTAEQLRASWGPPDDVNRTVSSYGTSEQWVYGLGRYVYLDDGVVRSWQD